MANRTCFLICPIAETGDLKNQRSRRLLNEIIDPVLRRFGFQIKHFLDPNYEGSYESIREQMMHLVKSADVCIADLTGDNPNVFFEYGLRRSTGRPVLAFIDSDGKLPFDVSDYHTSPYDLSHPEKAKHDIENFLIQKGFDMQLVRIDDARESQSSYFREYIERAIEKRIYVLQFSLFSVYRELVGAWSNVGNVIAAVLLMHPEHAKHYAGAEGHIGNIQSAETVIRRLSASAEIYGRRNDATVGLWYYRHEPSVAALIVGEEFLQLGWYFREPDQGSNDLLRVKGHNQPSIIVERGEARKLVPKVKEHFNAVWGFADLISVDGPKSDMLRNEWEEQVRKYRGATRRGGDSA